MKVAGRRSKSPRTYSPPREGPRAEQVVQEDAAVNRGWEMEQESRQAALERQGVPESVMVGVPAVDLDSRSWKSRTRGWAVGTMGRSNAA